MNWIVLIAGLLSALGLITHVTIGRKKYIRPMLEAAIDPLAQNLLLCQYHFVSVAAGLSTLMILLIGLNIWRGFTAVLFFIAANYLVCAAVQFTIALRSGISWGIFKINSWFGLVVVAALLIVGG